MRNPVIKNSNVVAIVNTSKTSRNPRRFRSKDERGEEGAILILALAYLVIVSLVVALLSTWVSNDLNNSSKFSQANALTVAASGMTDLAIQYVRYNPLIDESSTVGIPTPFIACWGGNSTASIPVIDGDQVAVWCSTVWNPINQITRSVTFDACPIAVSERTCIATSLNPDGSVSSNALLIATVNFDDYPAAPAKSAPILDLCSVFCGEGMTIVSWQWNASASVTQSGAAASMTFSNEPSDTTDFATTQAAVTVLDSSGQPVVGDTVTLLQQNGPSSGSPAVPGISEPTSTLTAVTDSSGIAEFTNIVPQLTGNYQLTAVDGTVTQPSTYFQVNPQASVITTSTAPANATQGGATYHVTATATTGDAVIIKDTTTSVCTLGTVAGVTNVATFVSPGTCTFTFNDPATGNPNYSAAVQVTQSFPVGGMASTQVGIALGTTTPGTSVTTNDSVTVTLENEVGATVKSVGTTTVVLSDVGSGFFSLNNASAGTATLSLTFPNGASTETAYFGGQTTGPDSVTAVNGTTVWGTAALTIVSGTPTQVAISPSTTTPTVSSVTNTTLNFQLEDQWGNLATSATPITLTLTNAGSGFFSATSGTSGTSTFLVTFPAKVGTATAYFGNQTSGSDVITAKNGASAWATSTLTLAAGTASQVQITLSPPSPATHATTNTTVTLQLEDQFGNAVQTSGVVLTLSNSGSGFFAKNLNSNGTPTLVLNATNASGVATGFFGDNTAQSDTITVTGTGISTTSSPFNV